jgi:hypothetical protein
MPTASVLSINAKIKTGISRISTNNKTPADLFFRKQTWEKTANII